MALLSHVMDAADYSKLDSEGRAAAEHYLEGLVHQHVTSAATLKKLKMDMSAFSKTLTKGQKPGG